MTTPSQTVGPFYTIGLVDDGRPQNQLVAGGIELDGQLFDGDGAPIPDGLIEAWDAAGSRWGRSGTDGTAGSRSSCPATRRTSSCMCSHAAFFATSGRASTSTTQQTTTSSPASSRPGAER